MGGIFYFIQLILLNKKSLTNIYAVQPKIKKSFFMIFFGLLCSRLLIFLYF
ncbi:hypothetical protein GAPWKB11_0390 [Gilliamella apicola]|nr:hypothetical protein GAPWKB11_0390 [Gilliamella apicola]